MRNLRSVGASPATETARFNRRLREQLRSLGDDGRSPRHVVHSVYPTPSAEPAQRPALVAALVARGFTVEDAKAENGLVLNHVVAVAGPGYDAMTQELARWLHARGWTYDGSECRAVVKP